MNAGASGVLEPNTGCMEQSNEERCRSVYSINVVWNDLIEVVMHQLLLLLAGLGSSWCCNITVPTTSQPLRFRMQEIDRSLKVGYSVVIADVNNDKKPDIVV